MNTVAISGALSDLLATRKTTDDLVFNALIELLDEWAEQGGTGRPPGPCVIAQRLDVPPTTVATVLLRLERDGHVSRLPWSGKRTFWAPVPAG